MGFQQNQPALRGDLFAHPSGVVDGAFDSRRPKDFSCLFSFYFDARCLMMIPPPWIHCYELEIKL